MRTNVRIFFACGLIFALIAVSATIPPAAGQKSSLPADVLAANQELDRQLIEDHKLLDADKIMKLFSASPDIFFVAPNGILFKGRDRVRQSWEEFFGSLKSIDANIDEISYLPVGEGIIALGQVTYHRQLKTGPPETRV